MEIKKSVIGNSKTILKEYLIMIAVVLVLGMAAGMVIYAIDPLKAHGQLSGSMFSGIPTIPQSPDSLARQQSLYPYYQTSNYLDSLSKGPSIDSMIIDPVNHLNASGFLDKITKEYGTPSQSSYDHIESGHEQIKLALTPQDNSTDFKILDEVAYIDGNYYYLTGQIQNTAGHDLQFVKVSVVLYDKDKTFLGTAYSYVDGVDISANDTATFKLMIGQSDISTGDVHDIDSFHIQVSGKYL